MTVLSTILVAISMYSVLPLPLSEWNERNTRFALAAFPLVGAVIGGLYLVWGLLCVHLQAHELLRAAGLCLLPAFVSGGIHLDGYADTSDALASHSGIARRQEILRDPHCGAFALIRLAMFFTGYFALSAALVPSARTLSAAALLFILSRVLTALALVCLPLAPESALARAFAAAPPKALRALLAAEGALAAAALLFTARAGGLIALAAGALLFIRSARTAGRDFGGMSGDLAGWLLCRTEFWMLAALVAAQIVEARL